MNKIEKIASKRGYMVSEEGKLYNPKGKEIGTYYNGYLGTSIRIKGKQKNFTAHRLQAYQKYGDLLYEDNILVRHLNGDSTDNTWNNIAIGTQSDNMMDIPKQIRIKKALHATSFMRKYDKEEVRQFYSSCKSYKETMKQFKITSKGTLHYILNS